MKMKKDLRVEAGTGDDHDTGTVDWWDETTGLAAVRWDSGVVTPCPIRALRALRADGEARDQEAAQREFLQSEAL